MSILDQQRVGGTGSVDYGQKIQVLPQPQNKPSVGAKLSKVAEIFELDIIDEEEALKACKVIIGQHAKVKVGNYTKAEVEEVKEKIRSVAN